MRLLPPGKERCRMRLNSKKILEATGAENLTEKDVCCRTGLYQKAFQWIVKGGDATEDAVEHGKGGEGMGLLEALAVSAVCFICGIIAGKARKKHKGK